MSKLIEGKENKNEIYFKMIHGRWADARAKR
jgi:hypothetical protein